MMGGQADKCRNAVDGLLVHLSNLVEAALATGGTDNIERRILSCVKAIRVLHPAEAAQLARLEAIEDLVVYTRAQAPEHVMAHLGDVVRDFLARERERAERREF